MVNVVKGDIFKSKCQTLVNTVNCVGVMGKGIALGFKERFPEMYADYVARCKRGEVRLGKPYVYKGKTTPWIINFPTKDHWRSVSKLEDIMRGLEFIKDNYKRWGIESIAFPPLGSGLGQLNWDIVGRTLYKYLKMLEIQIELYVPKDTTFDQMTMEFLDKKPNAFSLRGNGNNKIEPGLIAIIEILSNIEKEPYHWPLGRTSFQKVAYFATEYGLETGLEFGKYSFGPFAPNFKSKLTKLVNNGLIKEDKLGRMFGIKVGPTYPTVRDQYAKYLDDYKEIINKLTDLFLRVNTTQAEIAATIHFAAYHLVDRSGDMPSEKDVFDAVSNWKKRRRPKLDDIEIASTIRNLAALGWLEVLPSNELVLH